MGWRLSFDIVYGKLFLRVYFKQVRANEADLTPRPAFRALRE
jgi:hypothetical protein